MPARGSAVSGDIADHRGGQPDLLIARRMTFATTEVLHMIDVDPDCRGRPGIRANNRHLQVRQRIALHAASATSRTSASGSAAIRSSVHTSNTAFGVPAAHQTVANRRREASTSVRIGAG